MGKGSGSKNLPKGTTPRGDWNDPEANARMRAGGWIEPEGIKAQRLANADRVQADQSRVQSEQAARGMGYTGALASEQERRAGVAVPGFEGMRNRDTGALLDQYKINPFAGEASQKLRSEAFATGPSELAQGALNRQKFEESQARGNVGLQQQQAQSQAQSALMRQGGLGGGARTSLARSGARDALMANQGVASQGTLARFGINDTDMKRRQDLLGSTADIERAGDVANLDTIKGEVNRKSEFDKNRYNTQMSAWGAKQTADATRAAGGGGCFPGNELVKTASGEFKPISEIKRGDKIFLGGEVTCTFKFEDEDGFDLYSYLGTMVTGSHAVFEKGKWVRVSDSILGLWAHKVADVVYNLATKNHIIVINDVVFADNMETDEDFVDAEKSLQALNEAQA